MKLHTALLAALLAAAPGSAPAEDARTSTFRVEGMTCSLCGKAIDKALRDVDGVTAVEVDREAGRATVRAAPHVCPRSSWSAPSNRRGGTAPRPAGRPMLARELRSTVTCPECGHQRVEEMPVDTCQFTYECPGCGSLLKPKAGDCCVFCSFGSFKCPPVQQAGGCGP